MPYLIRPATPPPQGRRERGLLLFLYHTGARAICASARSGSEDCNWPTRARTTRHLVGQSAGRHACVRSCGNPRRSPTWWRDATPEKSSRTPDHPLRHSIRALCSESHRTRSVAELQEGGSACAAPYGSDPHAAIGSGSEHDPRMAGPRESRHDERLCRDIERKAKAVALFDSAEPARSRSYRDNRGLMAYLQSL